MNSLEHYSSILHQELKDFSLPKSPEKLYESIQYIVNLGGKRLRPLMVLMGSDIAGDITADARKAALVVELFHNFSLMHDDIMDNADLRRGQKAVHVKWNTPTAILGGDALLVKTYELLLELSGNNRDEMIRLYNKTALEVCEGQQMDMNFEEQDNVSVEEYTEMIRLKTAVLMGAALKLGVLASNGPEEMQDALYDYGQNLGIAFQLKDDYLDCFGASEFGKKVGGDIIENKKTYLQLAALSLGSEPQVKALKEQWGNTQHSEKVAAVSKIFEESGARDAAEKVMNEYYLKALGALDNLEIAEEDKRGLSAFAKMVWERAK